MVAARGRRPLRARRRIVGWAAVACVFALVGGRAHADVAAVTGDLERLRAAVDSLRGVQLVQDPGRLARFEVRLAQLEEELRRLTGRIEQLEFGQRSQESRIDQLIQDLDQRLRALEPGGGAPLASAPSPSPAPAVTQPTEARTGSPTPLGPQPGDETLGRVPESALHGLPRPDSAALTPPPSSSLPPQAQYDDAMALLRAGDYAGAEGGLQLFLDMNPDHALAPNAAYWLAESYYVRKNYAAAAAAFARNYRIYGKTAPKGPDNLLKLGMSLQGLQETEKACQTYAQLSKEFPNAPAHIEQAVGRERARAGCT